MINNPKKKYVLIISFFLLAININSQTIEWQNTIGGSNYEWLFSLELANDGNYILGGYSQSNISGDKSENSRGANDYWITKIDDNSGTVLWQKTIGGNAWDRATSTKETSDGGYILGGYSNSDTYGEKSENSKGQDDYWVVKLDSDRNIVWDKTYGGTGVDRLWSIIETDDGGFLMGGESDSNISGNKSENSRGLNDIWVIKTDSKGDVEWQKTYGGNDRDYVKSITKSNDGGYVLAGSSASNISGEKSENSRGFGGDYWILKIDDLGNILWQRTLGGNNGDYANFIQSTTDGNYIIGGDSSSNISGEKTENSICNSVDLWIIKLNDKGEIIWDKTIGGNSTEGFGNIREIDDKGFIIGAMSYSDISGYKTEPSIGDRDYWVVKLDKSGNFEWDKTFGGNGIDQLTAIVQAKDNSYVIGGWSFSNISGDKTEDTNGLWDYWILKFKMNSSNLPEQLYATKTICVGDNLQLNANSGVLFNWSGPNGFSSVDQNPVIQNVNFNNSGEYSVYIEYANGCTDTRKFEIIVSEKPIANSVNNIEVCEDFYNAGFSSTIDLSEVESQVLGSQTGMFVSYFDNSGNILPNPLTNTIVNNETITVRVANENNLSCYSETSFNIIVHSLPRVKLIDAVFSCDDNNDGIAMFDVSQIEAILLDGQTGIDVSYFYQNGQQLPNPIPNLIPNLVLNKETITAILTNPITNCINKTTFNLIVDDVPVTNFIEDIFGCDDNNDGISEYFDTSNIKSSVLENQTGIVVTYFDGFGNQLPSPLPNPFTNNIVNQETITVKVAKENNLNCFNETTFNLIVDTCAELDVYFPNFFTPNNDGKNDFWPNNLKVLTIKYINIYNRFGKILKIIFPNEVGWDGTYNGSKLPSTDYWFLAVTTNEKVVKGHFSLVR